MWSWRSGTEPHVTPPVNRLRPGASMNRRGGVPRRPRDALAGRSPLRRPYGHGPRIPRVLQANAGRYLQATRECRPIRAPLPLRCPDEDGVPRWLEEMRDERNPPVQRHHGRVAPLHLQAFSLVTLHKARFVSEADLETLFPAGDGAEHCCSVREPTLKIFPCRRAGGVFMTMLLGWMKDHVRDLLPTENQQLC